MAVKIIVDSTSDYSPAQCQQLGLLHAPLTLHWEGKEYRDGVDITPEAFFARLATAQSMPTTSQVAVPVFGDLFRQVVQQGDEAVVFTISHNLSGTFQSASIARDAMEGGCEGIYLVDTGSGSLASMLLVQEAVRMRDSGSTAAQIAAAIGAIAPRLCLYACVDTLKYLHKGGRLSTGAAVVGTLLSVKPVLLIIDGIISVATKVRGTTAAYKWVAQAMAEKGVDRKYPIVIGSTQCEELELQCTAIIENATGLTCNQFCDIGPVIGTHMGPGTVGIAYIKPE